MIYSQSTNLEADKDSILKLTRKIFGEAEISDPNFFEWQYLKNPEGRAIVITAKDDENGDSVVGVESILPMSIIVNQKIMKGSLSCNSYVDPDYRKKGIFSKLVSTILEESAKKGISCIYGVANDNSFNSFRRKGSFEIVDLPILFRPLRLSDYFSSPLNTILRPFDNLWKVNRKIESKIVDYDGDFDESFEILAEKASKRIPIIQRRTKEFLNWRYRNNPTREYKTFVLKENSVLKGYTITRKTQVNSKAVGVIVDFMVDSAQNSRGIHDLLIATLENLWNSGVSFVIATCGPSTLEFQLFRQNGFKIAPKFLQPQSSHFILIRSDSNREMEQLKKYDNWFFSFGDYDVF